MERLWYSHAYLPAYLPQLSDHELGVLYELLPLVGEARDGSALHYAVIGGPGHVHHRHGRNGSLATGGNGKQETNKKTDSQITLDTMTIFICYLYM